MDEFTQEIQRQLELARCIIVIWSINSITSRYVNAEALYGYNNNKLLPVMSRGLDGNSIPTPFNGIQAINIDDHTNILQCIKEQISKPQTRRLISKQARYELLSWLGVMGGIITIFTNVSGLLKLASWTRWVAENWHGLFKGIYNFLGAFVNFQVPDEFVGMLTFVLFALMTALGVRMSSNGDAQHRTRALRYILLLLPVSPVVFLLGMAILFSDFLGESRFLFALSLPSLYSLLVILISPYIAYRHANGRSALLHNSILSLFFIVIIVVFSLGDIDDLGWDNTVLVDMAVKLIFYSLTFLFICSFLVPLCFLIAPAGKLVRRIVQIGVGIGFLLIVNEISTFVG